MNCGIRVYEEGQLLFVAESRILKDSIVLYARRSARARVMFDQQIAAQRHDRDQHE